MKRCLLIAALTAIAAQAIAGPLPPDAPHTDVWARLTSTAGVQIVVPAVASYQQDLVFTFPMPDASKLWRRVEICADESCGTVIFIHEPPNSVQGQAEGFWLLHGSWSL